MSAFMLSVAAFQRIADALPWDYSEYRNHRLCHVIRPHTRDEIAASDAIIRDWYKANRLALLGRYGERGADGIAPALPDGFGVKVTSAPLLRGAALFKALQCLHYQCSEEVAPEHAAWHRGIMDEIEAAMATVCHAVIAGMPEYKDAAWG